MKVFVFDLLPYGEHLDHLKEGKELPWPLPRRHFDPKVAVRTYAEHLAAWEEMERLGYDGVGFNEHHTSPYGLMNSPNIMASAAAQRTTKLKLLMYGNLLPLHDPLRLAEELAMLDCLANGRIVSGFARGIPREHNVYKIPLRDSRARFEEAWEIIRRAWTEEVFSYQGRFWSYADVAIWPRPVQQPHPPVWVPVTGSKETIEWAARHDIPITPGLLPIIQASAFVADSKAQAVKESGPYLLYFNRTLFSHGNITEADLQRDAGYLSAGSYDYMRPENLPFVSGARERYRDMTMADVEREAEHWPYGTADEVAERLIEAADHAGASTVLINLNRGAMPAEMFLEQLRRFASKVLPALHAHTVTRAPFA